MSTAPKATFTACATPAALDAALGGFVADAAAAAIAARGRFLLASSGGSVPAALARALGAAAAAGRALDTARWVLLYADERHVALDAPESNHGAHAGAFAGAPWWAARAVPVDPALPLAACAAAYERALLAEAGAAGGGDAPLLDLCLLGMGPDGHTASLFPGHALLASGALVAPIADSPKPPAARVTLTLRAIARARAVAFVALGAEKAPLIARVAAGDAALPAARAGAGAAWFVDAEGAEAAAKAGGAVVSA